MTKEDSLKSKTVKGVFWSSIENFSSQGISFVFGIILARLLLPSDYGTIAVLTVFLAISQTFVNSGFSQALIRKLDRTEKDYSTAFYFNIVVGIICYATLFCSSSIIASFFNLPRLILIIKVIGLVVLFNSLCVVQQAQLLIHVDFKTQTKISLMSVIVSGVIGVIMGYYGMGVWSLVSQQVSYAALRCVLMWIVVGWKPTEKFSQDSFNYLFSFGSKLLASGLLDTIWNNIYEIVIGKFFAASTLGLYSRAKTFAIFPSSNFTAVFQRVTFPILSHIQNDNIRLRVNYRRIIGVVAFIVFPLMMLLTALSKPFVLFLLTEKWSGAILILQLLCLSFMWFPINMINMNLLQVKGKTDLYLKIEIVKKIMGAIALVISVPLGIIPMCIATIISTLMFIIINTYYTGKLINWGFFAQMRDLLPILVLSCVMALVVWIVTMLIESNIGKLTIGTSVGFLFYITIAKLFRFKEVYELVDIIKKR